LIRKFDEFLSLTENSSAKEKLTTEATKLIADFVNDFDYGHFSDKNDEWKEMFLIL
jgi:hypothetical protein